MQNITLMAAVSVSLSGILKAYGLMCLVMLPAALAIMIYAFVRRPEWFRRYDEAMDRLLGGQPRQEETEKKDTQDIHEDAEQAGKTPQKTAEQENTEFGIPNMVLHVGDRYQCYLSDRNRADVGSMRTWSTDNPFAGKIHQMKGLFEACRAGRCYIECGEAKVRIYYVDIRPNDTLWFGYNALQDLFNGTIPADIKTREITRQIDAEKTCGDILSYRTAEGSLTYTFDDGRTASFLFRMEDSRENRQAVESRMQEYMEQLKFNESSGGSYWIHRSSLEDDYPDSVDYVAFMKRSAKGGLYFGAGRCWRPGASKEEIEDNTDMLVRSFADMMDEQDVPQALTPGDTGTSGTDDQAVPAEDGPQQETVPPETEQPQETDDEDPYNEYDINIDSL